MQEYNTMQYSLIMTRMEYLIPSETLLFLIDTLICRKTSTSFRWFGSGLLFIGPLCMCSSDRDRSVTIQDRSLAPTRSTSHAALNAERWGGFCRSGLSSFFHSDFFSIGAGITTSRLAPSNSMSDLSRDVRIMGSLNLVRPSLLSTDNFSGAGTIFYW